MHLSKIILVRHTIWNENEVEVPSSVINQGFCCCLIVIGLLHHKQSLGFSDEHIILIHEVLCLINVTNSHMHNSKAWGIGLVMSD
jgi:hypothetical protein